MFFLLVPKIIYTKILRRFWFSCPDKNGIRMCKNIQNDIKLQVHLFKDLQSGIDTDHLKFSLDL